MIGTTDGHAKNLSIFYLPKNQYALVPLYDVCSFLTNVAVRDVEPEDPKMELSVRIGR